jgi:hypothetical protein
VLKSLCCSVVCACPFNRLCTMATKKRTTKTQFSIYIQHLQVHNVLRTGRMEPKDGPEMLDQIWKQLTTTLNSCGDGPIRQQTEWKKVSSKTTYLINGEIVHIIIL